MPEKRMSGAAIVRRNSTITSTYQERFQHDKSSIISRPPITEVKTFISSSSATSAENFPTGKATTKEMWRCDYCNKAKFHTYKEAERHEEKCKIEQYQELISAKDSLDRYNPNNLSNDNHETILDILLKLDELYGIISKDSLESTKIGRVVAALKKCDYHPIATKAKDLVKAWKRKIKGKKSEKENGKKTIDLSVKFDPEQNDHSPIKQHLRKSKKKKEEHVPTAPIFQCGKMNIGANSLVPSSKTARKTTDTTRKKEKPLASIFVKQPSESKVKKTVIRSKVETSSRDAISGPPAKSGHAEVEDLRILDNEEILSEHRKAEFLIERRKAEEERRVRRNARRLANEYRSGPSRPAIASFFQPVSKTNPTTVRKEKHVLEEKNLVEDIFFRKNSTRSVIFEKKRERKNDDRIIELRNNAPKFPSPNHVIQASGDEMKLVESQMNYFTQQVRATLICSPKHQCGVDSVSDNIQPANPMNSLFGDSKKKSPCPLPLFDPLHSSFSSILQPTNGEMKSISDNCLVPQLWAEKYTMNSVPHDVYGAENKLAAEDLLSFIKDWKDNRQQAIIAAEQAHQRRSKIKTKRISSKKRRYDSDDDFLSDSDNEDGLSKVYILCGPVGCGKTSLVYAAAKKSNCAVLEINTTDDRGGASLKKTIEECTQSHSSLALMKQKNIFFGSATVLQDTDDECDSNTALALILIDEVDLLFDSDVGFWQSLGNLAKKAKCPIILTATQPPPQLLNSTTILYRYAYLNPPSPMECASKMCQIAKMEKMIWQDGLKDRQIKEGLATIAKMCKCDLRKIMNEMQLYNNGSVCKKKKNLASETKSSHRAMKPNQSFPSLSCVLPNMISSSTHTVLQIRGKHFFNNPVFLGADVSVKVTVGEQQCPATKIVDDNNIFAVCPPCLIPTHVTGCGIIKNTHQRSLDCIHQPVRVKLTATNGIVYSVDSNLSGGCVSLILRYEFPEEGDDSNLDKNWQDCDNNRITKMLNEAVDEYNARNERNGVIALSKTSSVVSTQKISLSDDIKEMNALMSAAMDASDAAILEEGLGVLSAPLLSGAVHRCGEIVNNSDVLSCDVNSNYDQFPGCPNVYMTKPISKRDRFLYSATCEFSRGMISFHPELSTSGASSNNNCSSSNDDIGSCCMFSDGVACSISEEDLFLPSPGNLCATMVPDLIRISRQFVDEQFTELYYDSKLQLLDKEKDTQSNEALTSFDSILSEGKLPYIHNSYFNEFISSNLFLDYIPALRNMAMIERIANESFEQLKLTSNNEEMLTATNCRRRTRRSGPLVREHYFGNLIGKYKLYEAKDVGESFANMRLRTN